MTDAGEDLIVTSEHVRVKPMGVLRSIAFFIVPAAVLYGTHYSIVPALLSSTGYPYLVGYMIGWVSTMFIFFVAALAAYRLEGNAVDWANFAARYRLMRMTGGDWLWAVTIFAFAMTTYLGLSFTGDWLAGIPAFAPHPSFHPEFGPQSTRAHVPGMLMGMDLAGKWWVAVVFLTGWFLNICGEELWFRGYILPRQELALEKHAWIANGLMFGFNHIWQPWNLLVIIPGALAGAYVVQRRRNTWILIVMHALSNFSLVVLVTLNVMGIRL
jgi:membrane protease YdiL (CAAX protease family)